MKNTIKFFVSAVAVMATLAGCAKKEISNQIPETKTVQVVARHGQTKTTLLDSKYVRWTATDAVKAYGYLDNYVSTSTAVADGGATATFTFATGGDEIVYMVYPAAAAGELGANDWIEVTIPTEQTAVANGFADGANVAIGEYAEGEADFYSIGALVSFDIKNDDITSIKLEFPGAEYAVTGKGTAKIDTDTYGGIGDELTEPGTANYVELKAAQGQTLTNGAKYFAVVYADDYTGMKLTFTRNDGKTATYTNPGQLKLDVNSNYTIFDTQIPDSKWQGGESSVHDIFTSSDFPAESSTYVDFTGVKKNTAVYAGNSSLNNGISLRSKNSNSGIVTTTSGGSIKSVTVKWNSACVTGRTLDVYGSNSAYTSASDLYNSATQGDKLGSIVMGTSTSVTISDVYAYVAVRSKEGALNLDEIDFEWGAGSAPVTKYDVTCATVTGGTISANPTKAAEGATVTLTAEPNTGYEFESWNVTGATVAEATSATTTFTMPAANVTVSATFKEITSIPDKTIAEFIAAEGVNCYLTGVVSNIVNTTYGNFDLTDDSGKIYIYGCLTSEGVDKQFSTLGVEEGDKIKVIASVYELYSGKDEAKNVVFVEIVQKAQKYNVSVASGITNGTVSVNPTQAAAGQTVTITATPATGYKLKSVSAKKTASGTALTVTDNKFTMPAEAVTVSAEFEASAGGDPVTVTWVAKDDTNNPGNAQDWLSGSIDSNISWSATKGGSNNPKYYDAGSGLRVYNGGTFTVSAANGKKITKIVLTFSGTGYTFSTANTAQEQTYTLDSVESYSWDVSRTCRLQQVKVTYK